MSASLGLGPSLRRAVLAPKFSSKNQVLRNVLTKRSIQTQTTTTTHIEATTLLNKQRLLRPSSPHMTIYQPQLTWIGSIANRMTGVGLSVLLYGFSIGYIFVPGTLDTASIVEVVGALPETVKIAAKTILAAPFAFHSINGLRHLAWDSGKFLTLKGAYGSGYAVLAASAVATVGLVFFK